jgi:hypothetical protein
MNGLDRAARIGARAATAAMQSLKEGRPSSVWSYNSAMRINRSEACRRQKVASLSVLACVALFPTAGWGEGAVRLFDCTVVQVCNPAGSCERGSGTMTFRMEPVEVGPDGAGRYALKYDATEVVMDALSDAGPFVWAVGEERNTLLVSSGTQLLWHQLGLDPVPAASVRFLTCTLQ